jgi:SAM-dependent methyltransferase
MKTTISTLPGTGIAQDFRNRLGQNLAFLLAKRFAFLGDHIGSGQRVLEIGAGQGMVKSHLPEVDLFQTDVHSEHWLDVSASAEALPFADAAFDAVICIAAIHHMDFPMKAMTEFARVTRSGGKVLILEPHNSWLLRRLLTMRGHEYVDTSVDPFGTEACQRNEDNWDGNNAIGDLIFGNRRRLEQALPELRIIHHLYAECLLFMNSGGVNHKAPYLPLPKTMLGAIASIDRFLCRTAPHMFALVQEIVLLKT